MVKFSEKKSMLENFRANVLKCLREGKIHFLDQGKLEVCYSVFQKGK